MVLNSCVRCSKPTISQEYCNDCMIYLIKPRGNTKDYRPDKVRRVMIELELMAEWSTCQRRRVASALVTDDFQVLIPARNGTPRNQPHCASLTSPDKRCEFCIHAEKNCINRAARLGIRTAGLHLVTLTRPCLGCSNDIVEADIASIYYRHDYDTDGQRDYVFDMFAKKGIHVERLAMQQQEQDFSTLLNAWRKTWTSN